MVASLDPGPITGGTNRVPWDGTDDAGHEVASGVYLFEPRTGRQRHEVARGVLVK